MSDGKEGTVIFTGPGPLEYMEYIRDPRTPDGTTIMAGEPLTRCEECGRLYQPEKDKHAHV